MCGASAVQVGTANLQNPHIMLNILEGIRSFIVNKGIHNLTELIGIAQS